MPSRQRLEVTMFDLYQYEVIGPWWIIWDVADADYYPLPGGDWVEQGIARGDHGA